MTSARRANRVPLVLRLAVIVTLLLAGAAVLGLELHRRLSSGLSYAVKPSARATSPYPSSAAGPVAVEKRTPACGQDGLPECPLQAWMDQEINAFYNTRAQTDLAAAFRFLAKLAPSGYPDWAPWAEGGAAAADKGDFRLAKRACNGCHHDYRERYRGELRSRPLERERPSAGN
jgi:hypothetical protein